jgi:hypothetical protein
MDPSYLRYLTGPGVEGFYPVIPYREPDISLNQKILIIASISSIVFFVIALRRFRISTINKLRLKDFSQNIRAEILSIIEILRGRLGPQQHPLPSDIWDSLKDEALKRQVFNDESDYMRISRLYQAIASRNSEMLKGTGEEDIRRHDNTIYMLASDAFEDTDWTKYRSSLTRKGDTFVVFSFSILTAIFVFNVFEYIIISALVPSIFDYPGDVLSTPMGAVIVGVRGEAFSQFELIVYSIALLTISFILRMSITRSILRRAARSLDLPEVLRIKSRTIYLIAGPPLYGFVTLFLRDFVNLEFSYIYLMVLGLDIFRVFVLTWLIPLVRRDRNKAKYILHYFDYVLIIAISFSAISHAIIGIATIRILPQFLFLLSLAFGGLSRLDDEAVGQELSLYFLAFIIFAVSVLAAIIQAIWAVREYRGINVTSYARKRRSIILIGALLAFWLMVEIIAGPAYRLQDSLSLMVPQERFREDLTRIILFSVPLGKALILLQTIFIILEIVRNSLIKTIVFPRYTAPVGSA